MKRTAKAILPKTLIDLIRSRKQIDQATTNRLTDIDNISLNRFSTRDFFYRDENLETALDFMAICRN